MSKTKEKELQLLNNANLPIEVVSAGAGNELILASEILIPRLLLMQGLSEFVSSGDARSGDFIKSLTKEKVGDAKTPVQFIPLTYTTNWALSEQVGNKFEYRMNEPLTAANVNLPFEYDVNGVKWRRAKTVNLYALLPSDIVKEKEAMEEALKTGGLPDPDTALMPVLITFRITSYKAGQKVLTHFARCAKFNVRGYVSTLSLTCTQEKNDKGTFYVMDVSQSGSTEKSFLPTCEEWYKTLTGGAANIQVDDEKTAHEF